MSVPIDMQHIRSPIVQAPAYSSVSHFHNLFYISCKLFCFHQEVFPVELVSRVSDALLLATSLSYLSLKSWL